MFKVQIFLTCNDVKSVSCMHLIDRETLCYRVGLNEGEVEAAIAQRASARQSKDYAAADQVD